MALSLSMHCGIHPSILEELGTFDPILDIDTRLFLDPHLLKHTDVPEFKGAYKKLTDHFGNIARLLVASDKKGDIYWKKADQLMKWPEVKGLCIGFSKEGTDGSGIGPELRAQLLATAKSIITKGIADPEIFELVGMFQENFGSDRISDMTANVIRSELDKYTRRIISFIEPHCTAHIAIDPNGAAISPFKNSQLLLIPRNLLRDIPLSLDWASRDIVARHNTDLREKVNRLAGDSWKQVVNGLSKEKLKELAFQNPELIRDAIDLYKSKSAQLYDFEEDRSGEASWLNSAQTATLDNPLKLTLPENPTTEDVFNLVEIICKKFKSLIEDNGLAQLLYDSNGHPKHETASQLLFYGVSEAYCHANQIMIARESNGGRGPVDFKFGSNMQNSVLVEVKKSTNTSGLKSGIIRQLPEYMNAEGSRRAIYLVIDVGYTKAALANLKEINSAANGSSIKIFHVSGSLKESASKL
jgi:hypothetical protein